MLFTVSAPVRSAALVYRAHLTGGRRLHCAHNVLKKCVSGLWRRKDGLRPGCREAPLLISPLLGFQPPPVRGANAVPGLPENCRKGANRATGIQSFMRFDRALGETFRA